MKKILMTGGGTAGHVTPNIALFPVLKKLGYDVHYIGTEKGMERELIERENIPYQIISAGKLRRYMDLQNFYDIFRVIRGFFQALLIIRKLKPDVVFSKGGFVSCPVVWAAWINGIPAIVHESDITPGLANKLSMPFAKKICFTFPETGNHLPAEKRVHTGLPVRDSLLKGNDCEGKKICDFTDDKPVIVVIGGSLGSEVLNRVVRTSLKELLEHFQVCHICGRGGIDGSLLSVKGYKQFEYVNQELTHLFAMADIIVSRAGATVLYELLALKKPNLLIPLSRLASRGDQILNAGSFEKQGFSKVIIEEELSEKAFIENIRQLYENRTNYISAMKQSSDESATDKVINVIKNI